MAIFTPKYHNLSRVRIKSLRSSVDQVDRLHGVGGLHVGQRDVEAEPLDLVEILTMREMVIVFSPVLPTSRAAAKREAIPDELKASRTRSATAARLIMQK